MCRVLVPLANGFEEVEAMAIIDVLRRADIDVVIAGLHEGYIEGSRRVKVVPDSTLDEIDSHNFDMIVLPGGQPGSDNLKADERIKELIWDFYSKGKLMGAICAAPYVLAEAGILEGKRVTSYPSYKDRLGFVLYEEEKVVEDKNLLTSRGPGTALYFALAIVEKLAGREKAEAIRDAMLIPKS